MAETNPSEALRIEHFSVERVVHSGKFCALSTPGSGQLPRVGDEVRFVLRLPGDPTEYTALGEFEGYYYDSRPAYNAFRARTRRDLHTVQSVLNVGVVPAVR